MGVEIPTLASLNANPAVTPPSALAHVVLTTTQLAAMRDFYCTFLGAHVVFSTPYGTFLTYDAEHHRLAILSLPATTPRVPDAAGLQHIAFTFPSLTALLTAFVQRKKHGIEPHLCVNHGPTTSIYYKDPDGNMIETLVDNFESNEEITAYMTGEAFARNPLGAAFEPEGWIERLRGGEEEAVLLKRDDGLDELLAPSVVEFFSHEWHKLGDRACLKSQIHEVTTIPYDVLQGAPLSQSSVNERFRWRQDRNTKLKEDAAYSLAGIFDVEMAPIYGEGTEEAFRRLRDEIHKREECIRDLRPSDPRNDKKRIEDTKGGLLEGSYRWVLDNSSFQQWHDDPQSQLLWIKGDPGKGKTMLLCGIINELQKTLARNASVSYFFCQATDSRINSATAVLRGLLYLLVSEQPALTAHVCKRYDQAGKAVFEDSNAWIVLTEIFADVLQDPSLDTTYILVDALDECVTDLPKLLHFIAQQPSASSRVKWIVSSRNWPDIETQLDRAGQKLSLELNADSVAAAVDIFIRQKIDQLALEKQYKAEVRSAVLRYLIRNANDTFLWVALVCQKLEKMSRLNIIKKLAEFPPGLDSLYKRMIQYINESDDADICRRILAVVVVVVYQPIALQELTSLVEGLEDLELVREAISLCGSLLTVRDDTVYFVHQSAKDFLVKQESHVIFPSGREEVHYTCFSRSLSAMSRTLHRDMYSLGALGYPIEQVQPPKSDPLAASRYSCIYWIDHLCDWNPSPSAEDKVDLQHGGAVNSFLRQLTSTG
ncbi:NACHT-domain-containing protein [Melanomma pulvis-pyrius CBS 109.77]|uniref:NACHT-domain-containing protein n=1 Tax=Melanomma pulvis-pyrius CBS 109.77 TaxID=1314802 RepID=A0A6A6WW43_9PLEO|nr:NACHT-domain-containing protein [Melanomma pulvis-pyrius CBS 109.77]